MPPAFLQRPASTVNRPNFLLVLTDQQRLRALGAYGNPQISTPNMDSIATNGIRFERSYCTSPLCSPARASLVTGRMPKAVGVTTNGQAIPLQVPQLGTVLRDAGYETAWVGKWHVPQEYPVQPDAIAGFDNLQLPGRLLDNNAYPVRIAGHPDNWDHNLGVYVDDFVAASAAGFIRKRHDRPFCLQVSFMNPHDICFPAAFDRARIRGRDLPPLPANHLPSADEPDMVAEMRFSHEWSNSWSKAWDEEGWRRALAIYNWFTEDVDRPVGTVLRALRQAGLEEDTVIIFTSDHGEGGGSHRWLGKLSLYEESMAVPFIVSRKGVTPAGAVDRTHLVSGLDLCQTVCGYAGIEPPGGLEGVNLRELIENPDRPGREILVGRMYPVSKDSTRDGCMLTTGRYKYNVFSAGSRREQFFDLEKDPGEMRNLADDPAARDELDRHRDLLRRWLAASGDGFVLR